MATSAMAVTKVATQQNGEVVTPVAPSADWRTILGAAKVATATQSGVPVNPESFTAGDHILLEFGERDGTHIRARLAYAAGATLTADPIVSFFGQFEAGSGWEILMDKDGNKNFTLLADETNDVSDGTLKYTSNTALIDRNGCKRVVCGVRTAMTATGGLTTTNALVQVKPA